MKLFLNHSILNFNSMRFKNPIHFQIPLGQEKKSTRIPRVFLTIMKKKYLLVIGRKYSIIPGTWLKMVENGTFLNAQ